MTTNLADHSGNPVLKGAYSPLDPDDIAKATRYVVARGGSDLLDMLGLGEAS